MPTRSTILGLAALAVLFSAAAALACTTTLTGKDATVDGAVLVSHSDDGLGDPRLVYVPPMDHAPGSMRPVFYTGCALGYKPEWGGSESQRLVTDTRGPGYANPDLPPSVPLGYIPQVTHTYGYFDANYGLVNEHGLAFGECTDKAKVHPEPDPDKRLFYSAELSRVALERCRTAREAVVLMGRLIDEYGYYGTGETLLVADAEEGWVFEMCGYDMDGEGGVWVAKRVPDDGFFVAANQFRIRDVEKDADDMLHSANIFDVAKAKGWWKPADGPLDWARVYGDGEFHHPYYSLRRVWRAQSLIAPSLQPSPWVEDAFTRAYPFAITPDHRLDVLDVADVHRDNYEGTRFDLTKGLAAGPFGNPNRFEGQAEAVSQGQLSPVKGAFERPLNIYRCVYSYVTQCRSGMPPEIGTVLWYAPDRPATAVLQPYYAGALDLPDSVQTGDPLVYDEASMWTAFNYVANYAMIKYSYMIKDIHAKRDAFEAAFLGRQKELEAEALALWRGGKQEQARALLTHQADKNAANVLAEWWDLSHDLYVKYNDGYRNDAQGLAQSLFYPAWWLKAVGYPDGPLTYARPAD